MSQPPSHAEPADAVRRCALALMAETYDAARALIAEQGWSEDEGLRIVFASGLAFLRAERALARLNRDGGDLAREVERLIRMVMQLESQYAVMKFRVFELEQQNQTLRLNVAGLRGENELARVRLARFRADEARLRAELQRLRAQLPDDAQPQRGPGMGEAAGPPARPEPTSAGAGRHRAAPLPGWPWWRARIAAALRARWPW